MSSWLIFSRLFPFAKLKIEILQKYFISSSSTGVNSVIPFVENLVLYDIILIKVNFAKHF